MTRRRIAVTVTALSVTAWIAAGHPALALCSNASANASAQKFGEVMKRKMATKPDEMGDLADEFGDIMTKASDGVTERTCTDLEALVKRANAL